LAIVVALLGKYEHPRRKQGLPRDALDERMNATLVALFLALLGVLGFAVTGFHDAFSEPASNLVVFGINPFSSFIFLMLGAWIVQASGLTLGALRRALASVALALAVLVGAFFILERRNDDTLALNEASTALIAILLIACVWILRRTVRRERAPSG
jgi:hypothetical protein